MGMFKGWHVTLTRAQRAPLDELARRERRPVREPVREAVDTYLTTAVDDLKAVLDATFGSLPHLYVPGRSEWDR